MVCDHMYAVPGLEDTQRTEVSLCWNLIEVPPPERPFVSKLQVDRPGRYNPGPSPRTPDRFFCRVCVVRSIKAKKASGRDLLSMHAWAWPLNRRLYGSMDGWGKKGDRAACALYGIVVGINLYFFFFVVTQTRVFICNTPTPLSK